LQLAVLREENAKERLQLTVLREESDKLRTVGASCQRSALEKLLSGF